MPPDGAPIEIAAPRSVPDGLKTSDAGSPSTGRLILTVLAFGIAGEVRIICSSALYCASVTLSGISIGVDGIHCVAAVLFSGACGTGVSLPG